MKTPAGDGKIRAAPASVRFKHPFPQQERRAIGEASHSQREVFSSLAVKRNDEKDQKAQPDDCSHQEIYVHRTNGPHEPQDVLQDVHQNFPL